MGEEGGLFLRSNVRRVKSSLRAYKVSRCYRIELEGEEEKREEGKREEDWGRKDRGNKLWKREGYIYIYIYTGGASLAVPWSIDPISNQRFSIQISVGGTPI